jgi:class 3 adenylate cyclase
LQHYRDHSGHAMGRSQGRPPARRTANVGSRLCNQARAGEIVVSEEALLAAGGDANADRIGPLELKGIERQLVGYRITAPASRTGHA